MFLTKYLVPALDSNSIFVATYAEMDLDHHNGVFALLPSPLGYSVGVSMLDPKSGDLGSIPGSCTSGGDKVYKQRFTIPKAYKTRGLPSQRFIKPKVYQAKGLPFQRFTKPKVYQTIVLPNKKFFQSIFLPNYRFTKPKGPFCPSQRLQPWLPCRCWRVGRSIDILFTVNNFDPELRKYTAMGRRLQLVLGHDCSSSCNCSEVR